MSRRGAGSRPAQRRRRLSGQVGNRRESAPQTIATAVVTFSLPRIEQKL